MACSTPAVGLGTLGLKESAEEAVGTAVEQGVAVIDTGEHYGNLELVGAALKKARRLPYVIVKLSGLPSGSYESVQERLKAMLRKLGVERADLCLMHWPGLCTWEPTDMSPLGSPSDFAGKASSWDEFCEHIGSAWANLSKLQDSGLCSQVGTSNFYAEHLQELAERCGGAVPYANEIFVDSTNQESEFVGYMQTRGIRVFAYRPVAYKPFPDGVKAVAERLCVSSQSVVLAWLLRRGIWPLVKCRKQHIKENLTLPNELKDKLTQEDLDVLGSCQLDMRHSQEWFAKLWKTHKSPAEAAVSEEDVQQLVMMGVDEAKARRVLEQANGNLDAALDLAFQE